MNEEELVKALQDALQENKRLRQELEQAQEIIARLTERLTRLEGQKAKDSHNSGKPPSSDGLKGRVPKTRSLRGPSEKKSGGQAGHPGATLQMVEEPTTRTTLTPEWCEYCQQDLQQEEIVREERAQVWDLPPLSLQVAEYRAQVKTCPSCQRETRAAFPTGVKTATVQYGPHVRALAVYLHSFHLLPYARTCQLLSDVLGTTFSQASLLAALQEGSEQVEQALQVIKTGLIASAVMHSDETGIRVQGRCKWVHVAATERLTYYQAHRKRGKEAVDAIGILPQFQGVSVHDSLVSYLHYTCEHALCGAHYLRELTYVHEQYGQDWAAEMKTVLLQMKAEVQTARDQGADHLTQEVCDAYEGRYEQIVARALEMHPPPQRLAGTNGRPKVGDDTRKLLCRLRDYQRMILRFLHQFNVPFDNNLAERDLRMMKVRQKISGCFRTQQGIEIFCRLRSYLSTLHKQRVHLLTALHHLFLGSPLLPSLGAE
jgi:transposase